MEQTTLKIILVVLLVTAIEAHSLQGDNELSYCGLRQVLGDVYIVVFKQEATAQEIYLHKEVVKMMSRVGPIIYEYNIGNDFRGYSAQMTQDDAEEIQSHPSVNYVEKSQIRYTDATKSCLHKQPNSPWGLARTSSTKYFPENTYYYSKNGSDSKVYVIDSGIDIHHPQFQGRAIWGANFCDPPSQVDDHGHGTHVAGTIMSKTYGIAKGATAIAVRSCFNASTQQGFISACPDFLTIPGIQWVTEQHMPGDKSIMNLSFGGPSNSKCLDEAVKAAIHKGIHAAIAAGNNNTDACTESPARVSQAVTVGAYNILNSFASFSNYGDCVDINAPGVYIKSTLPNGMTDTQSGTSMAAPHVAGAMAVILESKNLNPKAMKNLLIDVSRKDMLDDILLYPKPHTPNRRLFIPCY